MKKTLLIASLFWGVVAVALYIRGKKKVAVGGATTWQIIKAGAGDKSLTWE